MRARCGVLKWALPCIAAKCNRLRDSVAGTFQNRNEKLVLGVAKVNKPSRQPCQSQSFGMIISEVHHCGKQAIAMRSAKVGDAGP